DAGSLGPQLGIGHHLFHVAEPIGPIAAAIAGEGTHVARDVIFARHASAAGVAAGEPLAALLAALALLWLALLLAILRLTGLALGAPCLLWASLFRRVPAGLFGRAAAGPAGFRRVDWHPVAADRLEAGRLGPSLF